MKKVIFLLLIVAFANLSSFSQNMMMKVYIKNGACLEYRVETVDSITFYTTQAPDSPNTDPDATDLPSGVTVVTEDATDVFQIYATVRATFSGLDGITGKAWKYGICLGKEKSPDIDDNVQFVNKTQSGTYSITFNDLEPNTLYYYRAVLYYDGKYYYGNSKNFTTPNMLVSFGYVDLGLSVKWGTCNLSANSPEERGNYYAWGETETKDVFETSTYKYYDSTAETFINIGDNISGTTYDAASTNLGTDWRTPTYEEISEIYDNCIWHESKFKGVSGYLVTSKTNGNSIFVPTVSCTNTSSSKARYSQFWSATSASLSSAYYLNYNYFKVENTYRAKDMDKPYGLPIRPVHK